MSNPKIRPYHDWSDTDFDWKALDQAAFYIQAKSKRWGRVGIHTKEKWGTLRVSTTCAFVLDYDFLHSLVYPGYVYMQWPKWVRQYIDWPVGKLCKWIGLIKLLRKYQIWVLKHFWQKAAKKWPHIAEEILDEYEDVL